MTDIYLVRHGQNEDNAEGVLNGHRDRPLTDLGREQARTVADRLTDKGITTIYASPLARARETAWIIGGRLGLAVQTEPDLIERDFGSMTGKPVSSILDLASENVLRTDGVNYFLEVEGAENFPSLYERAKRVLVHMGRRHPSEHILLVAHGDVGKMIRAAYHGWDWKTGLMTPYLDNTGILELRPSTDLVE